MPTLFEVLPTPPKLALKSTIGTILHVHCHVIYSKYKGVTAPAASQASPQISTQVLDLCSTSFPQSFAPSSLLTFTNLFAFSRPVTTVTAPNSPPLPPAPAEELEPATPAPASDLRRSRRLQAADEEEWSGDERQPTYPPPPSLTVLDWPTWAKQKKARKAPKPLSSFDATINSRIHLFTGNIMTLPVDAIVNAAKSSLLGGGGIDGKIHKAAGRQLRTFCSRLNGCRVGDAKTTPGFNLLAKFVIHAVGPNYSDYTKEGATALLRSAYHAVLTNALNNNFASIAIPCISTGIFGFPGREAADVAASTIRHFLQTQTSLKVTLHPPSPSY